VGGAWNPHAMSLARIWRDQGKVSERANCMLRLRAVYGGLRTRDLKEAKALLDELS